jgi:hypothetical protein
LGSGSLSFQWEPKSVITFPSGGQQLSGPGTCQLSGLAWSAGAVRRIEVSTDGGQTWKDAEIRGAVHPKAHTRFGMDWKWDGRECVLQSRCTDELGQVQPSRAELAKFFKVPPEHYKTHGVQGSENTIQPWRAMGACTMRFRILLAALILCACGAAWAQSPTYGVGKTPTPEEIRAEDITISPDGTNLRRGKERPKKVPRFSVRNARCAMERTVRADGLRC